MSIPSRITALPGSDLDLPLDSSFLSDVASINTTAMISPTACSQSAATINSISVLSTKADAESGQWVISLIDSRGPSGEVGIVALSCALPECIIIELSDTPRFTRTLRFLSIHTPALLITCDTSNSRLGQSISEAIPGVPIQKYPRSWFNERAGRQAIDRFALKEIHESLVITLEKRYYALSSFGALIQWVEDGGDSIRPKSLPIKYTSGEEGVMIIDYHTSKALEIVRSTDGADRSSCLLATVDQTNSPMGARLLCSNLLQPLTGKQL